MTFGHLGTVRRDTNGRLEHPTCLAPPILRGQKALMLLRSFVVVALFVLPSVACSSAASGPPNEATGSPDGSISSGGDSGSQAPSADSSTLPEDANTGSQPGQPPSADGGDAGPDLDMQASDFGCILSWPKVGDYRITNKLGDLSGSLAIANAPDGGVFPVGTVVQLIPNEAMVKRRAGFSAASDDWEFFNLSTSATGTTINQRGGGASVTNFTGSSCLTCHSGAAPQWDMICGTTHGCTPLPISESTIQSVQNGDPRCAGVDGG